jgi:type II secretion system protein H
VLPVRVDRRGFSLIEFLVVLVVVAIASALAYLRLGGILPVYRLDGAARSLALELQKVRGRAVGEGRCFQVVFDAGARTYRVRSKAGVRPCGTTGFDSVETPALAVSDSGAIGIQDPHHDGAPESPVFDPNGRVSTPSVVRVFDDVGGARNVYVQATGRVHVQ